jgi:large subunit ribosomal protein L4e
MKASVYNIKGEKRGEIDMPKIFESKIREDIVKKYFEVNKLIQPYASDITGGKKHSASGIISHKRHDWKGHYGRGISRIPRKIHWRSGSRRWFWIGAEISSARGGRRAHPPKGIGKEKKINKKEIRVAMNSGYSATANEDYVLKRYGGINKVNIKLPIVIEVPTNSIKSKEIKNAFKKIFGELYDRGIVIKNRTVRAGKGKSRGRKYKSNAGILLVTGESEKFRINGIEVKNVRRVSISDMYPLGRLTVYTQKALSELEAKNNAA